MVSPPLLKTVHDFKGTVQSESLLYQGLFSPNCIILHLEILNCSFQCFNQFYSNSSSCSML
ncbi:unnamed protein product, partial [Staurois parvus]